MVCLGNICRSPVAEGVLRSKIEKLNLPVEVDSAGTSNYHIGECPDRRSILSAHRNGIDISGFRARQFTVTDFDAFDLILSMDMRNLENILKLARNENDIRKVQLLLEYSHPGKKLNVPDPYFGGEEGFNTVFSLINNACDKLVENIKNQLQAS